MGELFAGRYELADPIGRGGVGEVWRAWDHRRGRYVAAKVLKQSDAHALLRFVREQSLRIDHPHVLAPTSWAADDDKVLFTMDLVRGGSVAHLIGDYGALPPRLVCTLLDQLLAGLSAVHAEGVVHRDIKPANLLLEATGAGAPRLRLSDFGISVRKGETRLTETNYVVGTPGYFAPEQLTGADPDFPQDLYAVGLVAMYMLTGTKPDSEALVASYPSGGFPAAPEGVPSALWQVVAALLDPDPEGRFRTATGVRKALADAVELLPGAGAADPRAGTLAGPPGGVVVPDRIGPLPEGFGPGGPVRPGAPADPRMWTTGGGAPPAAAAPPAAGAVQPPAPAPPSVPVPVPPPAAAAPAPGAHPSRVSDSGSFLLAPPAAAVPATPVAPAPFPEPYRAPGSPASGAVRRGPAGPPRMIVVPVLLIAAACYAIGFWALLTG